MKPLTLFFFTIALSLSNSTDSLAQNVAAFYEVVVSSKPSDTLLDQQIDSLWEATLDMDGDTSSYAGLQRSTYADALHNSFVKNPNSTSGQKAALYAHFIWLRNRSYQQIITNYQKHSYPTDLWIAGYPIYRRSFFKYNQDSPMTPMEGSITCFQEIIH